MTFTMIEPKFFSQQTRKIQLQSKIFNIKSPKTTTHLEIFPNLYRFIFVSKKNCLKNYGRTSLTHTHIPPVRIVTLSH